MARFDVYRIDGPASLVIDVQADLHSDLHSRVVVPLLPAAEVSGEWMPRLRPRIQMLAQDYILCTPEIAAIPTSELGQRLANLEDQRSVIIDSIDFLLQGF